MKIAILSHGQPRFFDHGYPTFRNLFDGCETDYYFHHWTPDNSVPIRARQIRDEGSRPNEDRIVELTGPKRHMFEPQKDFMPIARQIMKTLGLRVKPAYLFRVLSQYYSLAAATGLIENIEEYDYVLKIRTDLYFDTTQKLNYLVDWLDNGRVDALVPYRDGPSPGDTCFFAPASDFKNFTTIYDLMRQPSLYQDSDFFRLAPKNNGLPFSHVFVQWFFDHHGMQYRSAPFPHLILRDDLKHARSYEEIMRLYLGKQVYGRPGDGPSKPGIPLKLAVQNNPARRDLMLGELQRVHNFKIEDEWFPPTI